MPAETVAVGLAAYGQRGRLCAAPGESGVRDPSERGASDRALAAVPVARNRACQTQPIASRMISVSTLSAAMPSGQRQLPTSP